MSKIPPRLRLALQNLKVISQRLRTERDAIRDIEFEIFYQILQRVLLYGPVRFMQSEDSAVPYDPAEHRAKTDIILIREDGWSLGCDRDLFRNALETWPGNWLGYLEIVPGEPDSLSSILSWSFHQLRPL